MHECPPLPLHHDEDDGDGSSDDDNGAHVMAYIGISIADIGMHIYD